MFKYFPSIVILLLLISGCSSSDSPEAPSPNNPNPPNEENIDLATLTSTAASNITETSAEVGGNISNNGGAAVTERGVVWGLNPNPTVADNKLSIGSGNGSFTNTLSGLEQNTTYYFRAFAVNSEGTSYGNEEQFSTLRGVAPEKIFDGDVLLTSQTEVDEFGSEEYQVIKGNLIIKDSNNPSTIVSLALLSSLRSIEGSLEISENNLLESINEFENLEMVGGDLSITNNSTLKNVSGFDNISSLSGNLSITENILLNLEGFMQLEFLNGWLEIRNARLIQGFNKLQTINSLLRIANISEMTSLDFLPELKSIAGSFHIWYNPLLTDMNGLQSLEGTLLGLDVSGNNVLKDFSGLSGITLIDGFFNVSRNDQMVDFSGLGSAKILADGVTIRFNNSLESLKGLEGMESIGRNLRIESNPSLSDMTALRSITVIGDGGSVAPLSTYSLLLSNNNSLYNVEGFENLTTIYGKLDIRLNENLQNLDGFSNLSHLNTTIEIYENSNLDDFCGLKSAAESLPHSNVFTFGNKYNPQSSDITDGVCKL